MTRDFSGIPCSPAILSTLSMPPKAGVKRSFGSQQDRMPAAYACSPQRFTGFSIAIAIELAR